MDYSRMMPRAQQFLHIPDRLLEEYHSTLLHHFHLQKPMKKDFHNDMNLHAHKNNPVENYISTLRILNFPKRELNSRLFLRQNSSIY